MRLGSPHVRKHSSRKIRKSQSERTKDIIPAISDGSKQNQYSNITPLVIRSNGLNKIEQICYKEEGGGKKSM